MDPTASPPSGHTRRTPEDPLTDRLLARLPGPRWLWIGAWALLPVMHWVVFMQVLRISGHPGYAGFSWALLTAPLGSHAVLFYMIILSIWATRKLVADARELEPTTRRLHTRPGEDPASPFVGLSSPAGPIAFSMVVAIVESAESAVRWGVVPAILFLPYLAVWVLPMMTLFWVYITFLLGLDRLGRTQIALGSFPEDLSLGLGPIGTTVFNAFLIFCAISAPFLLGNLHDRLDLTIGLAFFGAGVGAFFLSVWRLHRKMVETKRTHISRAAALYAETYEPLRTQMTPATLHECGSLLGAAEALVKRAVAIQEWPFDDRTMTRIVGISTGVATAVIARFVLSAIGL